MSQALDAQTGAGGDASRTRSTDTPHGSWLAGRYELVRPIGGGGMGIVHLAEDHVLGRQVAIKVLPFGSVAADPSLVNRFDREARAAASLCHPNIVSVFDAGSDGATRFIVMEFVKGMSLAAMLSRDGRLDTDRAAGLAAQIAKGLAAAHRAGIIHRDVKPANVMVDEAGTVKLLDFGIARARSGSDLTQTGSVLGSARCIAPEVALGRPAEERSDVYSLGCVLYEMVTGQSPFTGDLDAAVVHQHVQSQPRRPRTLAAGIPPALEELIMRMLSKRPADRPAAAELAHALGRSLPQAARRRSPRHSSRSAQAQATAPLTALDRPRPRRRLKLWLAAAAVLLAAGSAVLATGLRGGAGPGQTAAATTHRVGGGHHRSAGLLPVAGGAIRDATRLVALAVTALEAARAPAPYVAPQHRRAAHHKKHPSKKSAKKHADPPPNESGESEGQGSADEAEVPATGGQTGAPPVQTAPAEAPAPAPQASATPTP